MKRELMLKIWLVCLVTLMTVSTVLCVQSQAAGGPVQLLEPPDGAINVQLWQSLKWTTVGTEFHVKYDTDPDPPFEFSVHVPGGSFPALSALNLTPGTTYYWNVIGYLDETDPETGLPYEDWYEVSPTWSFTMGDEVEPVPHIVLNTDEVQFYAEENGPLPDPQILTITNSAGGVLYWYVYDWCDWIERDPASGASNFAEVELSVNTTNLPPGFYWRDVYVYGSYADNDPQTVRLEYTVDEATGIAERGSSALPEMIQLSQNYPNPFNPATEIDFALPRASHARLEIFNSVGQRVSTLVDRHMAAGHHTVSWYAGNMASGVYIYRLTAGEFVESRTMLLVK